MYLVKKSHVCCLSKTSLFFFGNYAKFFNLFHYNFESRILEYISIVLELKYICLFNVCYTSVQYPFTVRLQKINMEINDQILYETPLKIIDDEKKLLKPHWYKEKLNLIDIHQSVVLFIG